METRTPRFNEAIEKYFASYAAGPRTCPETGETFELEPRELAKYQDLSVPPSQLVWWAQMRRMRAFLTGSDFFPRVMEDGRTVITAFDPESPVKLIPSAEWYAERLKDGLMAYALPIDPTRSFFEQWATFTLRVPRPALFQDPKSEKSDWTNYCVQAKNDYFGYISWTPENCLYCDYGGQDKNSCDITGCDRAEWSYENVRSDDVSQTFFCERCNFGINLFFCRSSVNCQDCFGSTNLRNKKYYFLNEQLSEEEYKRRVAEIDLGDQSVLMHWHDKIKAEIWDKAPHKALAIKDCEDVGGDDLQSCRDSTGIICFQNERTYLSFGAWESKDSCTIAPSLTTEQCVYSQQLEQAYGNKFCSVCISCIDIEYSEFLINCEHCFGCIGLQGKKYCVFNKQYTEQEYWQIIDELKTTMLARGEYGEFFPYATYLTAYNTSNGDIFYPSSEAEMTRAGARWFDFIGYQTKQPENATLAILPLKLTDFNDAMLNNVFRCEESGRLYRIVKPELEWHRKFNIALPRLHPTVRRKKRSVELYPIKMTEAICAQCHQKTATRIPAERNYIIYCQPCHEDLMLNQ